MISLVGTEKGNNENPKNYVGARSWYSHLESFDFVFIILGEPLEIFE